MQTTFLPQTIDCNNKTTWSDKTVLVIENDSMAVLILSEYLYQLNLKIKNFTSYNLNNLNSNNHFDLIIKGIDPNEYISGLFLTKNIILKYPQTPIIAHSTCAYNHNIDTFKQIGCHDFLPKPYTFEMLQTILLKYLN